MIVRSEFRDLDTPTGPMRTYVYTPTHPTVAKKYPGLLLYSEIFQQTAPIARLCVQLASHGHVVMAPEIYHEHEPPGTVLAYDDVGKDKGNRYKHATKLSTFDNDARAVVRALRAHPACSGRIGTVGFCIGGHLAVRAALLPEILACASFFPTDLHSGTLGEGKKADTLARVREIKGGRLHLATDDGSIGYKGSVLDLLKREVEEGEQTPLTAEIFTCGPHGLLHEVADFARARGIRCEASLEGPMACAVGACRGCPVPLRAADGNGRYPAMCVEGPVMDATIVDWARLP